MHKPPGGSGQPRLVPVIVIRHTVRSRRLGREHHLQHSYHLGYIEGAALEGGVREGAALEGGVREGAATEGVDGLCQMLL